MADLLYRLGFASSRRPWVAIVAWLGALALSVGGFLAFGGTLTTRSPPGTPTSQVTDRLQEEFRRPPTAPFRSCSAAPTQRAHRRPAPGHHEVLTEVEASRAWIPCGPLRHGTALADQRSRIEDGRASWPTAGAVESGRDQLDQASQLDPPRSS